VPPGVPGELFISGDGPPGFDRDVQRLEPLRDAVQVLTMHKAKGLEAPVVFVAGLGGAAPQGESLRVYHLDGERRLHLGKDPVGEIAAAIEAEEAEEIERLYYVALTRARARLYLPDAAKARVCAAGLTGDVVLLSELHGAMSAVLQAAGFRLDHRKYLPHITLVRYKFPPVSEIIAESVRTTQSLFENPQQRRPQCHG